MYNSQYKNKTIESIKNRNKTGTQSQNVRDQEFQTWKVGREESEETPN